MSDETKVVSAEKTTVNATPKTPEEISAIATSRAEDVAQKKLAELSYAEGYRQKLRSEKANRRDNMRQRAEAEQMARREREREERRLKMEAMLSSEREAIAERNAGSDEVLSTVGDAERDRLSRRENEAKEAERRAEEARLAEEQAKADAARAAEARAAEEKAAEEKAAEARAAEEKAAEQAAAQAAQAKAQAEAEARAKEQREKQEELARKAEEQARLAKEEAARKVAEELRIAKAAEAVRRAAEEEKARLAEEVAAEKVRREAAEQVRQIVEHVEAERAAEKAAAEERAAAERAASEQAAAEARAKAEQEAADKLAVEKAAAERAEEEKKQQEQARLAEKAERAAREQEERDARRDALYTEASEMAEQHILAAKAEAQRRRGEDGAEEAEEPIYPTARAASQKVADDPLRAEREKARELAAERVRADRMADTEGRLAKEDEAQAATSEDAKEETGDLYTADRDGYAGATMPEHAAFTGAPAATLSAKNQLAFERREGRLAVHDQRLESRYRRKYGEPSHTAYRAASYPSLDAGISYPESTAYAGLRADEEEISRSAKRLQTKQQAWGAKEAVREAREAEKEAVRTQRALSRVSQYPEEMVDYEAERSAVKSAELAELPAEPAPLTPETISAAAVIREEKDAKRNLHRARKAVRKTLSGKKANKKDEKTVAKLMAKETHKKDISGRKIGKEIVAAERSLAKAERKEARAQKRVDRAQRAAERLLEKQTAMETKHAKRLARRPGLAKKLNLREEALAKEIAKAYKSVDRAARKEEKKEARVYAAQQRLDKLTERQSRMERRADKRIDRLRRAEGEVARRTERYDRRADKKLRRVNAQDHAAARENITVYKKELPRSLQSTSSRQLDYEKSRVKKGALTEAEAKKTLDAQRNKIPEVLKAEARLSSAERDYRSLDRKTARIQGKLDRLLEKQASLEERDRQLVDRDPRLAPKLIERERAMSKKIAKMQKKVNAAERRQDRFEAKHVNPAVSRLERAEARQQTLYDKQARRLMRAKRRSDRDAYRARYKTVQRRNLEETYRETNDLRAVDSAELGALTDRQGTDSRKIRLLKRQVKQARSRERLAARRADRSRRMLDKTSSKNTVSNYQNERTVERNPKAYNAVFRKTEKERVRLERLENQHERDLRRLDKASRKSDTALRKLEEALGKQRAANAAVVAMYDRTAERDYVVAEPKAKRQTLREKRRELKRSRNEEREYERLLAAWQREERKALSEQQEAEQVEQLSRKRRERRALATGDTVASTAVYAAGEVPLRKTESILANLDRLYDERQQIERKLLRDSSNVALNVRLVNLQKDICDEHFDLLRKTDAKSDSQALPLAESAVAEIRRYNEYVTALNNLTGAGYPFAKLTTPYRILEGRAYTSIKTVTYRGVKTKSYRTEKASAASYDAYDDTSYVEDIIPDRPLVGEIYTHDKLRRTSDYAMTNREFSKYVNDILKTNVDISKERDAVRRQLKSKKHNGVIRIQTEVLRLQKEILDNYIRIFSVAYEEGRTRRVKGLARDCVKEIKYFNRELTTLERMDGTRHVRVDTGLPHLVLSGRSYEEIPSMVCVMPGRVQVLDHGALNDNFTDVDAALIESRYNYRIAALTRSLKDMSYDYVLFQGGRRRTKRQKKKLLARTKADRKLAVAAEARDNRRYEALVAFEPIERGRRSRKVDNQRMSTLRADVSRLLARRDELNRELLSLYAMMDDGVNMRATERYEDGTMGRNKKFRGKDDPYIVKQQGYLTKGGRQVYSPDTEYALVYSKEKRRQYNKHMKNIAAVRKLRLPDTHPDMRALFNLYNRRIELLALVNTADKKIRIYGYKGKAAKAVHKERKAALRELKQIDRETRGRIARAKKASRRRPRPFWA